MGRIAVARQKAANDCARHTVDWRQRALTAEHALDIAEGTASMIATDRDDAMADADRVADSWHELLQAALAVLSAVTMNEGRTVPGLRGVWMKSTDEDGEQHDHFALFAALKEACEVEMPGGGAVSRAERYRAALEKVKNIVAPYVPSYRGLSSPILDVFDVASAVLTATPGAARGDGPTVPAEEETP